MIWERAPRWLKSCLGTARRDSRRTVQKSDSATFQHVALGNKLPQSVGHHPYNGDDKIYLRHFSSILPIFPAPTLILNQCCSGKSGTNCLVPCMCNVTVYWIILTCMSPDFWPGAFPLGNLEHSEQPSGQSCILNSYVSRINAPWSHLWSIVDRIQLTNVSFFIPWVESCAMYFISSS